MRSQIKQNRFAQYAWAVLALNLLVILWGGYVSASGSGDGCGASWPHCEQFQDLTTTPLKTFVEVSHRLSSGLAFLAVVGLTISSFRRYTKGHLLRHAAAISLFFMFTESLVGALIVLMRWVADSDAIARVFTQPLHLVNTFLLLASLALTAWWASGGAPLRLRQQGSVLRLLLVGYVALLLVGTTGTFASLASHLFPAESFAAGVQQDFSAGAPFFVKLRIWHPIAAALAGLILVSIANTVATQRPTPYTYRLSRVVIALFITEFLLGTTNAILNAPIAIQMIHLIMADAFWLVMVLLGAAALAETPVIAPSESKHSPTPPIPSTSRAENFSRRGFLGQSSPKSRR
ncbi:MAG: COX15/CtaA family protein [Chloroflexi bacterium]|nr:COX15/CtaA family protein [Chloroflexota bacterium]MBP8058200.1 COX15/CtaA family protein [Chloroflexota bacterium]